MGFTKNEEIKQMDLNSCAIEFLKESRYITETLDGTLFTRILFSNDPEIYIRATSYFKKHNLEKSFTLSEFRDKVKKIIDQASLEDPIEHDIKYLDE